MSHRCAAPACKLQVPQAKLMCKSHWFALPKEIRDRIWAHYKPGQTLMTASPEYLQALRDALAYLRSKGTPA